MNTDSFNYIVFGSGHGGGPLASNLTCADCSTFLIEAGDKEIVDPPNNLPNGDLDVGPGGSQPADAVPLDIDYLRNTTVGDSPVMNTSAVFLASES
ncbi:hypothetical protein DL767_001757 [Monosporascus sp. MG133]|nr:hypothetical protein DL767_001757 [Monosporascus sp. MG133]